MTGTVTLYAATSESLEVPIKTNADPTATPPEFALSSASAVTPGTFVPGAWSGAWVNGTTTAVTATLGATASMAVVGGTTYQLWVKVTLGGEVAVWPVGRVQVP